MATDVDWQWLERKRRLYQARLLGGERAMVPALEARIKQNSPDTHLIVLALYHALQETNAPWLWELLWSWVASGSARLRAAALAALRSGLYAQPGVRETLWEHAGSESTTVRRAAIASLLNAMEAGLEFRPRALKQWVLDEDVEVRLAAVDALEIIGEEHQRFGLGLLQRTLQEPEARTADGRSTHDAALAALNVLSHRWMELVLFTLERLAPAVGEDLCRRIAGTLLVYILGERHLGALPHLQRWLQEGRPALQQLLVWSLPLVPEEPRLDLLERLVREESEPVRREVVRALTAGIDSLSPGGLQRAFAALNFAAAESGEEIRTTALDALRRARALMNSEEFRRRVREQRRTPAVEPAQGRVFELDDEDGEVEG